MVRFDILYIFRKLSIFRFLGKFWSAAATTAFFRFYAPSFAYCLVVLLTSHLFFLIFSFYFPGTLRKRNCAKVWSRSVRAGS